MSEQSILSEIEREARRDEIRLNRKSNSASNVPPVTVRINEPEAIEAQVETVNVDDLDIEELTTGEDTDEEEFDTEPTEESIDPAQTKPTQEVPSQKQKQKEATHQRLLAQAEAWAKEGRPFKPVELTEAVGLSPTYLAPYPELKKQIQKYQEEAEIRQPIAELKAQNDQLQQQLDAVNGGCIPNEAFVNRLNIEIDHLEQQIEEKRSQIQELIQQKQAMEEILRGCTMLRDSITI